MKHASLILFLFLALHAKGQQPEIFITREFNSHFSQTELRKIIRDDAWTAVSEHGVSRYNFDKIYPVLEQKLLFRGLPRMKQAARWLESTGSFDYQLYRKELARAIRDVVLGNEEFSILRGADATDRVLSHHSDIHVRPDGWVDVTETITVNNGSGHQTTAYLEMHPGPEEVNNEITRGIVRAIPNIYTDHFGLLMRVPVQITGVTKDGLPEDYHTVQEGNSSLLYAGSANRYLADGVYTYSITYKSNRQVAYHDANDELYWNVNGNFSTLRTDSVSCTITFPRGSVIEDNVCFTGYKGSKERNCTSRKINDSTIYFTSQVSFDPKQGLTVAAFIQKGIIAPRSKAGDFKILLADNWPIPAMLFLVVVLFIINYIVWRRVGKDPNQGTIIPQFDPPDELSPADCGFIYKQEYKPEQFGAALTDIAVKNGIKIVVKREGKIFPTTTYQFARGTNRSKELKGEVKSWYDWDITTLYDQVASKRYNGTLASMSDSLKWHLSKQFHGDYDSAKPNNAGLFRWNSVAANWQTFVLVVLGIAAVIITGNSFNFTVAAYALGVLALGVVQQIIFSRIMNTYTVKGRKVMDEILGFKMYLATAEQRPLDKLQPPEKTLELYEKFLPYAIALECQNQWAEKFEEILKNAFTTKNYRPAYYDNDYYDRSSFSVADMGSFSSGLSSTIAEASVAPSESGGSGGSDSGGGGSSGGGGGGGGTGGW